ncbi:hypothetical protein Cob_v012211 [Colletotrichum orbiculare MAFF 240422]|uniref:Uncharacterized protein n=1 Tax=Colletotrichum orbiculare (strain 104-T / ATCC 96160 / CBS 514.97 / LARS 414 / MAFF 240422) TaxID=1213857 RepID=A0A484FA99_COLOR|nr:hypothetical protein Cob_v012211 [Colletotrichum orbiculare MAFF 240422]
MALSARQEKDAAKVRGVPPPHDGESRKPMPRHQDIATRVENETVGVDREIASQQRKFGFVNGTAARVEGPGVNTAPVSTARLLIHGGGHTSRQGVRNSGRLLHVGY